MVKNLLPYERTDKCLIDGIKRFPANHFGTYQDGKLKFTRYWNTLDHLVSPSEKYEDQVDEFRYLLTDACKIRMRSDVPIGTALSGGLDSSAVISIMSQIVKMDPRIKVGEKLPRAFIASFSGTILDETKYAKKVVDHLQIEASYVNIDPLKSWGKIYEYFYLFEEIFLTSPVPMIQTYHAVKDWGVSVTLDGHGADELFSGYGHLIEALWDVGIDSKIRKEILRTLAEINGSSGSEAIRYDLQIYLRFMLKKLVKKTLGCGPRSLDSRHEKFSQMDYFSQQLYILFHESILPTLLRNYDRYSMMNGVEVRMPFLDHRIVSYVFSLPFSSKFGGGYTKRILRDSVAPFLPSDITYRKTKIGFNSPIIDWMQGPLKEFFEDTVNSHDFLNCELVEDRHGLKKRIMSITKKEDSTWTHGEKVWADLSPYIWEKAFIKNKRSL